MGEPSIELTRFLLWMDETMALPSASTIRQLVVKSVAVGSHQTAVAGSKDGIR